jgi:multiple sugar transport system substrate-binding protein
MSYDRTLESIAQAWRGGTLSRRGLIARASALGMSGSAIGALLSERNIAFAQDTPTPAPTQTPIAITSNEGAKVRIQFWTILSGPDGDEMSALVQKFSDENTDIGVDSLQGLLDFVPKLQAAGISGTAPDVALLRHHYIGAFASKGVLTPITSDELAAAGIKQDDWDPTVWGFTTFEDQQYTVPLDVHCFAQFYNKALLGAKSLAVPTTIDELKAVAQATTDRANQICGYQNWIAANPNSGENFGWLWWTFQAQFGGQFLNEDNSKAAFNTPEGVAALQAMVDLETIGNPDHLPYFDLQRNGQVATWPDGPWIITPMTNTAEAPAANDIAVAPIFQKDPSAPAVWAQSHQFSLPKQSDNNGDRRAASLKFIEWMTAHSVDWAKAGQIPARNSAREEVLANTDNPVLQDVKIFAPELAYAKFWPSDVPTMLEIGPRIGNHAIAAILGQESVADALKAAEEEVNDIIANG